MSKAKLFFFAVLFLFVSWAVFPQDTSPSTESELYWKTRCLSCEEVLMKIYSNLNLSEEDYQVITNMLNDSDETINSFLNDLNLSEEEIQRIVNSLKDTLNNTTEPEQKVNKHWRTAAFVEALMIICGVLFALLL